MLRSASKSVNVHRCTPSFPLHIEGIGPGCPAKDCAQTKQGGDHDFWNDFRYKIRVPRSICNIKHKVIGQKKGKRYMRSRGIEGSPVDGVVLLAPRLFSQIVNSRPLARYGFALIPRRHFRCRYRQKTLCRLSIPSGSLIELVLSRSLVT